MLYNSVLSMKVAEERANIDKMLAPLYAEAEYLLLTIDAGKKEGLEVSRHDERHYRIDELMDQISDLINQIYGD